MERVLDSNELQHTFVLMTSDTANVATKPAEDNRRSLIPDGKMGTLGRDLSLEKRSQILDVLFFESDRRKPYLFRFVSLMVFSSSIAALGLMNDSTAVVIGAMLVAPLMTPIMAFAAALVQTWTKRIIESFAIVTGGALLGIAMGWLWTQFVPRVGPDSPVPSEVLARTAPNLADLGIAILAGAAGAYVTVRSEAGSALPGVGIAVALVPPLASIGITLAADRNDLARGALLLFLTNFAAISLAAGVTFALAGFVPPRERLRQRAFGLGAAVVFVLAMAVPLASNTATKLQRSNFTVDAARAVQAWDSELRLEEVQIDPKQTPKRVTIVVTGEKLSGDPEELAAILAETRGERIEMELIFVPQVSVIAEP
jgi:uncharacterized hydrophobic protein (TIGR00271 family)